MDLAQLAPLLVAGLRELIQEELIDALDETLARRLSQAIQAAQRPEYMTRPEAAKYIGRSVRSLDALRSGKLAWSKRGGRVMIATADLDAYLNAGRVPVRQTRQGEVE